MVDWVKPAVIPRDDAACLSAVDTGQVDNVDVSYRLTDRRGPGHRRHHARPGIRERGVVTNPGSAESVRARAFRGPTTIRRKQPCFAECSLS